MELENIGRIEEVPAEQQLPFPPAPIEIVVHNAVISIQHMQAPDGRTMVLARFMTPATTVTIKLDGDAANAVADDLRVSPVEIARVLPK
jgi:hypothetical protein